MSDSQVAVLSDVHGNVTAFEAVLADIASRGIHTIYNLGDVVGKGPRGSRAVQLSRERCTVTVRGNWDDMLCHGDVADFPFVQWWRDELSDEDRAWLGSLPESHDAALGHRRTRVFHASSTSVYTRVHQQHSDAEFDAMFRNTLLTGDGPVPTVVCYGDIHAAYAKTVDDRTLINVGSVGNSLDGTTASYVILVPSQNLEPPQIEFVRVPYDREAEIAVAAASGMPELDAYTVELRTAVYRGLQRQR